MYKSYKARNLDALSDDTISIIAKQKWNIVYDVLKRKENSTSSLKALLSGAILSTAQNSDHPLKQLNANDVNFPCLLELADLRNKASHASGHQFDQAKVMGISDFAIQWTTNFKEWF